MKHRTHFFSYLLLFLLVISRSQGQGTPTAIRALQLSTFALLGDTYTGLSTPVIDTGGRNFTATLGLDAGIYRTQRVLFAAEIRGAYPINSGEVDGQRSLLAGIQAHYRFATPRLSRLQPYLDILAGRGEIRYVNGGYQTDNFVYASSSGAVYSAGGGLGYALTRNFSLQGEVQFQRWSTPVIASGSILAVQGSAGLGFALRFGGDAPR